MPRAPLDAAASASARRTADENTESCLAFFPPSASSLPEFFLRQCFRSRVPSRAHPHAPQAVRGLRARPPPHVPAAPRTLPPAAVTPLLLTSTSPFPRRKTTTPRPHHTLGPSASARFQNGTTPSTTIIKTPPRHSFRAPIPPPGKLSYYPESKGFTL